MSGYRINKSWSTKEIELARKLYYEGKTYIAIAEHFGCTRNAIAGICNRFKFERGPMPIKVVPPPKKPSPAIEVVVAPPPPPPPSPPSPKNKLKSLVDLEPRDCRWPIGDNEFMFCAEESIEGKPYCLKHCKIAYVPSRYAERSNA
jgi:GcrA cell cycle regulator